jgi:hypothetical protein
MQSLAIGYDEKANQGTRRTHALSRRTMTSSCLQQVNAATMGRLRSVESRVVVDECVTT